MGLLMLLVVASQSPKSQDASCPETPNLRGPELGLDPAELSRNSQEPAPKALKVACADADDGDPPDTEASRSVEAGWGSRSSQIVGN